MSKHEAQLIQYRLIAVFQTVFSLLGLLTIFALVFFTPLVLLVSISQIFSL